MSVFVMNGFCQITRIYYNTHDSFHRSRVEFQRQLDKNFLLLTGNFIAFLIEVSVALNKIIQSNVKCVENRREFETLIC